MGDDPSLCPLAGFQWYDSDHTCADSPWSVEGLSLDLTLPSKHVCNEFRSSGDPDDLYRNQNLQRDVVKGSHDNLSADAARWSLVADACVLLWWVLACVGGHRTPFMFPDFPIVVLKHPNYQVVSYQWDG